MSGETVYSRQAGGTSFGSVQVKRHATVRLIAGGHRRGMGSRAVKLGNETETCAGVYRPRKVKINTGRQRMGKPYSIHRKNLLLRGGVSLAALAVAMISTAPARAADAAAAAAADQPAASWSDSDQAIIVIGSRPSVESSLQTKKDAATEVDSLSATDIGSFPDNSVSEALQRVPGITVTRLQSADDSSHFSGEPSSVLVRGLTLVRTEFDGEDSFSADAGRGLNFNDVSPELLAGVDVYKNQTADMIEGGIGGTVDLRTRLPFDSKDQIIEASAFGNYGDRSAKTTPDYSMMYSNSWNTKIGRIGAMVDYANSHIETQTNEVDMTRIGAFCNGGDLTASGAANMVNGNVNCTSNPFGGNGWAYAPEGINYSQVLYDRKRHGTSAALQWQNPDETLLVTARMTDSYYHNAWSEKSVEADLYTYNPGLYGDPAFAPQSTAVIGPYQGTNFGFAPNGMLQSGIVTLPPNSVFPSSSAQSALNNGSVVPGLPFQNYCGAGATCEDGGRQGTVIEDESRIFNHTEGTRDWIFNAKYEPNDHFSSTVDLNLVTAYVRNYDVTTGLDTIADVALSTNKQGVPQIQVLPDPNTNYAPGFTANPSNYYLNFVQDHFENDGAREIAAKWDTEYKFDGGGNGDGWLGWLSSLKAGVRYADRDQSVLYSEYNWSNVAASWACMGPALSITNTSPAPAGSACDPGFKGYGPNITNVSSLKNFFNGQVAPNGNFAFINQQTINSYALLTQSVGQAATGTSPTGWNPIPSTRAGCPSVAQTQAQYGCYTPAEALQVQEKTYAGYIMANFGAPDAKLFDRISYVGNFGVRVIETDEASSGGVVYPNNNWYGQASTPACDSPVSGDNLTNISCFLTPGLGNFSNAGGSLQTYTGSHTNVLPSFNVRFGITDDQFIRIGASEAMSRPDIGSLRNYVQIAAPTLNTTANSPYIVWKNPAGPFNASNIQSYNFVFQAQAGNAAIQPMTADQYDLTYEYYINKSSAFTVDGFIKQLHNPITLGEYGRSFTNNGVTENVLVQGPVNGAYNGGTLEGVEVAYSTFFDFLPDPFKGFGIQANYTHVRELGINNSNLVTDPVGNGGTGGSASPVGGGNGESLSGGVIDPHRLAGVSDDAVNVTGVYENDTIAIKLAYTWRSQFLVSNIDCCIGLPVWQRANGYLDSSIHYKVNDYVEMQLDGKNLLDTTSVFAQQVQGDSPQTPGAKPLLLNSAWVKSDRAVKFGFRVKI